MPKSRSVNHYAPGSNRVSIANDVKLRPTRHSMPHPLPLEEQIAIRTRLRRWYAEEDCLLSGLAEPEHRGFHPGNFDISGVVNRARSFFRQPLRMVRQP